MKKYSHIVRHSGNLPLFDILDISVAGTLTGTPVHVHAEGLRGTGKTTIIRAFKEVLPKINRIRDCLYNCDPEKPHCPQHRNLTPQQVRLIGVEQIDMPFLEISHSAKKGTVVGSIDLQKISSKDNPEAALLLGTIPKAHRGIIFVDEINRIADTSPEIVDLLLDVMGTKPGRIQIEEAGFPVLEMPVQVSIWAASNPDEEPGPLEDVRRQLSDRFDFAVRVERPANPWIIKKIIGGDTPAHDNDVVSKKRMQFLEVQKTIHQFEPTEDIINILSSMYVDFGIESLRCIEACLLGIKIRSALLKQKPTTDDVVYISKFALRHRVNIKELNSILTNLEKRQSSKEEVTSKANPSIEQTCKAKNTSKGVKTLKDKNQNASTYNLESFKNIFQRLAENFKSSKSERTNRSTSNFHSENYNVKAPPKKAVPIDKLDLTEYVKTEEELI